MDTLVNILYVILINKVKSSNSCSSKAGLLVTVKEEAKRSAD